MFQLENFVSAKPLNKKQQALLVNNLDIATQMANVYRQQAKSKGVAFDQVVSESTMGLVVAVKLFDPSKGETLSVFATNWCKKAILALFNDDNAFESLDDNFESEESADELLALTSEAEEVQDEQAKMIQNLLNVLNPRELEVITLLFGLDGNGEMSVDAVAKKFGVKPARICQIRDKALGKMRRPHPAPPEGGSWESQDPVLKSAMS